MVPKGIQAGYCCLVGGSHRTPKEPHHKKLESRLTFPEHLTVSKHLTTPPVKSLRLTEPFRMGILVIHVSWVRTQGYQKGRLPSQVPTHSTSNRAGIPACCLAVGAMLTHCAHNWGFCLYLGVIPCGKSASACLPRAWVAVSVAVEVKVTCAISVFRCSLMCRLLLVAFLISLF